MPSDGQALAVDNADQRRMNIASVRILRMALGTALSLLFSQALNWPMSFVAPVLTMFILALPLPAMNLANGIKFILAFVVSLYAGLLLLPFVVQWKSVGFLLAGLALYHTFYFTARGGSAVLGTFATMGLTLVVAIGSVSVDAVLAVINWVAAGAVAGVCFVWVGHALLPDSLARPPALAVPADAAAPATRPDLVEARRSAWRSLLIILPVILWFVLSSASASYVGFMIKVATMGQQANVDQSRQVGASLLKSTVIGGVAAVIGWQVLTVWPSLIMYVLLIGLAGLVIGPRVFAGPALQPNGGTWSYGYLTMIIVLAPAVLDSQTGAPAGAAFWSRLIMFVGATIYGVGAVYLFDALWRRQPPAPASAED